MALPPGSFAACCPASTRRPAASRVAADDLVGGLLPVLVLDRHGSAEEHATHGLSPGGVDDLERLEHLLQPMDLRIDLAQLPLAQLVLVVLAAVAVRGGHRHLVGY